MANGGDNTQLEMLLSEGNSAIKAEWESWTWIRRRYERIECLDSWTILRTSILDTNIDQNFVKALPKRNGAFLIPLKTMSRASNLLVEITDGAENHIPHLSRREERELLAAGLISLAPEEAEFLKAESMEDAFKTCLKTLNADNPQADSPQADATPNRLYVVDRLVNLNDDREDEALVSLLTWDYVVGEYAHRWLVMGAVPQQWWETLDTGYQQRILVRHPEGHRGGSTPSRKEYREIQLESGWRESSSPYSGPEQSGIAGKWRLVVGWIRSWAALLDLYYVEFDVNQLTRGQSFHIEFISPPGTYVHHARISGNVRRRDGSLVPIDRTQTDPYPDRAHIYVEVDHDWKDVEPDTNFRAMMRPTTAGGMRGGLVTSAMTSALLWWLLATLLPTLGEWEPWFLVRTDPSVQSIVTILLLGPTLLAALVLRQGEHSVAKSVLYGFRRRTILQGILAATFATMIAVGAQGRLFAYPAIAIVVASTLLTAITIVSYGVSWMWLKKGIKTPTPIAEGT